MRGCFRSDHRLMTLWLFPVLLLAACDDVCDVQPLGESVSPNGAYVATVTERDCGATTPFVRVVSLRRKGSPFDPDDDANWVFTVHGRARIELSWAGNSVLGISLGGAGDVATKRYSWKDIDIVYL